MTYLTAQSVLDLFPHAKTRVYDKNQIICYNGDKPQNIYVVVKGYVRYYDIDERGNEKILHINGPSNVFPMLYAFGVADEVKGFYGSIDKVELLSIPMDDFHKQLETNIEFSNFLIQWFLREVEQLFYRIDSLEKTEAPEKIMYAIKSLVLNHGHSTKAWQKLDFPVTQQFIADFTGLARETVSIAMRDLEKKKVIRTEKPRSLEVKQSELNKLA